RCLLGCRVMPRSLPERPGPRHIEGVIDERFRLLHELDGVREIRVNLEGSLVGPARVNMKEPRIARGAIGVDHETAGLAAREADLTGEQTRERPLLALAGMEAGEDEELHRVLLSSARQARSKSMIQLASQVRPASGEKACSHRHVSAVGRDHRKRTRIGRPLNVYSAGKMPKPASNRPTLGGLKPAGIRVRDPNQLAQSLLLSPAPQATLH